MQTLRLAAPPRAFCACAATGLDRCEPRTGEPQRACTDLLRGRRGYFGAPGLRGGGHRRGERNGARGAGGPRGRGGTGQGGRGEPGPSALQVGRARRYPTPRPETPTPTPPPRRTGSKREAGAAPDNGRQVKARTDFHPGPGPEAPLGGPRPQPMGPRLRRPGSEPRGVFVSFLARESVRNTPQATDTRPRPPPPPAGKHPL